MKTTKEKIEVMQAYEDGKKIEIYYSDTEEWRELKYDVSWDWLHFDYRVKEEPPKQRMTNLMLMEWLSEGYGVIFDKESTYASNSLLCCTEELTDEVNNKIVIRPFDSDEWIEPTVDIYERDCKGGKE